MKHKHYVRCPGYIWDVRPGPKIDLKYWVCDDSYEKRRAFWWMLGHFDEEISKEFLMRSFCLCMMNKKAFPDTVEINKPNEEAE